MFDHYVVEPLSVYVPREITPNMITIVSGFNCWAFMILGLAAMAYSGSNWLAMWLRVAAGSAVMLYGFLDCLDGVHARRTKQVSAVGEVLDHWVDSFGVPLCTCTLVLGVWPDNLVVLILVPLSVVMFTAQLALYNSTGRYAEQETSGVFGQIVGGFINVVYGIVFYYLPRSTPAVLWLSEGLGYLTVLLMVQNFLSYGPKHGWKPFLAANLPCCLQLATLGALYWSQYPGVGLHTGVRVTFLGTGPTDFMTCTAFVFMCTLISLRVNGNFVIASRLGRKYNGIDIDSILWVVTMVISSRCDSLISSSPAAARIIALLPFIACTVLLIKSIGDMNRVYNHLMK